MQPITQQIKSSYSFIVLNIANNRIKISYLKVERALYVRCNINVNDKVDIANWNAIITSKVDINRSSLINHVINNKILIGRIETIFKKWSQIYFIFFSNSLKFYTKIVQKQ